MGVPQAGGGFRSLFRFDQFICNNDFQKLAIPPKSEATRSMRDSIVPSQQRRIPEGRGLSFEDGQCEEKERSVDGKLHIIGERMYDYLQMR